MPIRTLFAGALAAICLSGAAHASTVTYDLNFSGNSSSSATSYISFNETASTGTFALTALNITLDGVTFGLQNAAFPGTSSVTLKNGAVSTISYLGTEKSFSLDLLVDNSNPIDYTFLDNGKLISGTVTPLATTPLPSSWAMLLGGVGLFAIPVIAKRRSKVSPSQSFIAA